MPRIRVNRLPAASVWCVLSLVAARTAGLHADEPGDGALPAVTAPPESAHLDPFYRKYIEAEGLPIVGSAGVSDYALREAAYLARAMLAHRPDIRRAMVQSGSRLCIIAHNEFTTDLPEFAHLAKEKPDELPDLPAKEYWDARARGLGGDERDPLCSSSEENLLGYAGDPYAAECVLIHELAHNIHLRGMVRVDPTFDTRLQETYRKALEAGLWKNKYAAVNHREYFAEGAQSWFDNNRENDHDHNHVNTRAELIEYDPGLAAMCREVFGDTPFKYTRPATRLSGHLAGFDPAQAPRFVWPQRLDRARAKSAGRPKPAAVARRPSSPRLPPPRQRRQRSRAGERSGAVPTHHLGFCVSRAQAAGLACAGCEPTFSFGGVWRPASGSNLSCGCDWPD